VYSDISGASRKFLRGYQITDANGVAQFETIYPGWYAGRAVHIHFKLRLFAGSTKTYEFTSQFFMDDTLTDSVYTQSPYSTRGSRTTRNVQDGIYNSLSATEKTGLTLQTTKTADGYAGVINLGVSVG
jgi:protocatechuate 3,4-dioxygenase beta subunit